MDFRPGLCSPQLTLGSPSRRLRSTPEVEPIVSMFLREGLSLTIPTGFLPGHREDSKPESSQSWDWAHARVDRFAVLYDLWTWEANLLESKRQVRLLEGKRSLKGLFAHHDGIHLQSQHPGG